MPHSEALVIETNNLRGGGAGAEKVAATLERLMERLRPQLPRLAEVVITHDGLPAAAQERLTLAAGRALAFVRLPAGCGYYAAKNLGFEATASSVVAFADADCWPEPRWLEALLAPFDDASVQVTAGRTTYRGDLLGIAATTIDFM
jgi:glycosyltransferase involved in cell wall biosynthesis